MYRQVKIYRFYNEFIKKIKSLNQKKTVAIIVPIYKGQLNIEEEISLKHLRYFLDKYDKYFIMPDNLSVDMIHENFSVKKFPSRYFRDPNSYNVLMLSKRFYKAFNAYEYILIYQLDSLVFSDQLLQWCRKGYDYIGAPWFKKIVSWVPQDAVGNGGFSLRRVQSCIKVLTIYNRRLNLFGFQFLRFLYKKLSKFSKTIPKWTMDRYRKSNPFYSLERSYRSNKLYGEFYKFNEDIFWGFEAKRLYPEFKIAPPEIAVFFSFETGAQFCFEKTGHTLPFGCHAWARYNKDFWQPYLLE